MKWFIGCLVIIALVSFVGSRTWAAKRHTFGTTPEIVLDTSELITKSDKKQKSIENSNHIDTPSAVKGIYMSQCAAATPSFRDHVLDLLTTTELNAVVIDIKDYTGTVAFMRSDPELEAMVGGKGCRVKDMKDFIRTLHDQNVYVIGRVTVFQDPYLAQVVRPEWAVKNASDGTVWRDRKGLSFIDVGAKDYWNWVVGLAKESYGLGFDEINFDYIRYPSDGDISNAAFTLSAGKSKPDALEDFFIYLHNGLKDSGMKTSADIFGMTTTAEDDMNIGQVLERTLPYFDYVSPMVYPSHYPNGFNGWSDPNLVVYDLIKFVMESGAQRAESTESKQVLRGVERKPVYDSVGTSSSSTRDVIGWVYPKPHFDRNKLRPWLQDFDLGGDYGPKEVRDQIQATYDAGLTSWLLWDPSNQYTKSALQPN